MGLKIYTDEVGKKILKNSKLTDISIFAPKGLPLWELEFPDGDIAICRSKDDIYRALGLKRQGKEIPADF